MNEITRSSRVTTALQVISVLLIMAFLATACEVIPAPLPVVRAIQASPTASAKPVEVNWLVRSSNAEQDWENKDVIPGFEAQNPNIKINLVVVSSNDFDTRMQTMIAAEPHQMSGRNGRFRFR